MKLHNWSSDNIAFGSGGGLLQEVNKDTLKCVYKCSYAVVNGKGVCYRNKLSPHSYPAWHFWLLILLDGCLYLKVGWYVILCCFYQIRHSFLILPFLSNSIYEQHAQSHMSQCTRTIISHNSYISKVHWFLYRSANIFSNDAKLIISFDMF